LIDLPWFSIAERSHVRANGCREKEKAGVTFPLFEQGFVQTHSIIAAHSEQLKILSSAGDSLPANLTKPGEFAEIPQVIPRRRLCL
jgi:hypothetical protein